MSATTDKGLGWHRDPHDARDLSVTHASVRELLARAGVADAATLPPATDMRADFGPVRDQGKLNSCTAQVAAALVEYFHRRSGDAGFQASPLFLYKVERNLLRWQGDKGAYLRTAFGALALVGVPQEAYWPYDEGQVDAEPGAFCYAIAGDYRAARYVRLDTADVASDRRALLDRIRRFLATRLPLAFGTPMNIGVRAQSFKNGGALPYPSSSDIAVGGHAMLAAGYDDGRVVQNTDPGEAPTTGALLVRNSWGPTWGESGYGWLPYAYVLEGLAADWWSLLSAHWIETGQFGLDDP